ncbi:MAG: BamA/TamA family outer membrane protein [Bacteroidia bacterium]|nr:BamA/TamA family outer membrane protein [Bacteroidia bacterium]
MRIVLLIVFGIFILPGVQAQQPLIIGGGSDTLKIDYTNPKEYIIADITVQAPDAFDKNLLIALSGLVKGDRIRIPGDDVGAAIKNLWKTGLFRDVHIHATRVSGDKIFLNISVVERSRLNFYKYANRKDISKSEAEDLSEMMHMQHGMMITDELIKTSEQIVKDFLIEKGYLDAKVRIEQQPDTSKPNHVILIIHHERGPKIRIKDIVFHGNTQVKAGKLRRKMKETKRRRWYSFNSAKFYEGEYEKDLDALLLEYKDKGMRDAKIVKDTMYRISPKRILLEISIDEGKKYYFRNISWVGNSKYSTKDLQRVLNIKKGDVYNQGLLESRLFMNASSTDISSLYMDDGYLFFQITPVEILVEGDSIDIELRVYEGKQAIIDQVTISGNTKTNDKVVMREVRTRPGQLFRRSDIIRTQRELAALGYFDAEKMQVNPKPNPADGTVDIEYIVEEKPNDQLELSGGFGAGRVVGTLGVSFNNFSGRSLFKKGAWTPVPAGDGQRLSIRAQSYGVGYQSYNLSFTEPWLGGKKPNSLSVTVYHSVQTNGQKKYSSRNPDVLNPLRQALTITGVSVGLGKRLAWPDDFFQIYLEGSYKYYNLNNYRAFFSFNDGYSQDPSVRIVLSRNSMDFPAYDYPTSGSNISLTTQFTPYLRSVIGKLDLTDITDQEKYKFLEYYKFKFTSSFFTKLLGRERKNALVLNTRIGFGLLGYFDKNYGLSPFERFYLGGSGLTGFSLDGREIIALRGYDDQSVSPPTGAASIVKYTLELRYPISLNPSAMVYGLGFAEGGNSWATFREFNPFSVKRSAGIGVRVFLPMFGLLGLDYGWRFDDIDRSPFMQRGQLHFTIGMNLGEL